ncbi:MAG: ATP-grasp domain-containing protein [Eubacteriales bacterium]|nr:ATP-grasp domain-containing protein [Eubacteriales bacterium]
MNILLTSAGRRTYLVEYFKQALGNSGEVHASNSVMSPALVAADRYVLTPIIYSEEYIPFLLEYCKENDIKLLVSLFDIDLPVLARHKNEFKEIGTLVAVSDKDVIDCCNDKYSMSLKLWKSGIRCPECAISISDALLKIDAMSMHYPLIIKPRYGMGSISINKVYDKKQLKAVYDICKKNIEDSYLRYESEHCIKEAVLIQECAEGNEYGMDVINDFDGRYINTIVRRKVSMRAGETDEAVILGAEDPEYKILTELGRSISEAFSHIGNMDVDVIMSMDNMRPYVIDMNARFGGGYPFSHLAGANLPKAYIEMAEKGTASIELCSAKAGVHGYKDIVMSGYKD